ncbi:MAG TPA: YezD family protein [Metalysinibacillus jejuensis]|uniref:YezD family protein n=1 Tax=Metalysinibacillus jejuensis TaxID=914327 RepID=A0A921NB92_9BACL|nr:YezD family protein [Metalysinibacillus jejuensis]HJH10393.1 YezD family protein [Metalysinibacillus jejuensis]
MAEEKNISEAIANLQEILKTIQYGNVTLIIQDGHIVQIEKHEKIRLK